MAKHACDDCEHMGDRIKTIMDPADSTQLAAPARLRPIYLLVVFWGEVHRGHFAQLLLPSLLAPGNLPAIASVRGSKLVLCTTKPDWDALQSLPLFEKARQYIQPLWIEMEFPLPETNKYLHSAAGFKRAVQRCWQDVAYASFLVPDLILSDGTLKHFRKLAADGSVASLIPSLRYDSDGCLAALRARGLYEDGQPIVASGRELAGIGLENLHSQIKPYEWGSPTFSRQPFSVWWRLSDHRNILLHTTGWQMALVDFHALQTLNDTSLDYTTQDDVFIDQNFYRFRGDGTLRLVTDSDDAFYLSLTSERDFTCYPLKSPVLNRIPGLASTVKFYGLQLFLNSRMFDAFRRWVVTVPCYIHEQPLPSESATKSDATIRMLRQATRPPPVLVKLYGAIPSRILLRSYLTLALNDPRQFIRKAWRQLSRLRKAIA
jgi:hypothetical protein